MANIENQRIKAIANSLTREDLAVLDQGEAVYLGGLGMVMPEDLKSVDAAFPEWRKRLEESSGDASRPPERIPDKPAAAKQKQPPAEIIPLPFWHENERGIPCGILRSALFVVMRRGRRKELDKAEIVSLGNIKIIYTGFQLDQFDLDVFLQCLHLFRSQKCSSKPILISEKAFLKAIGRSTGKNNKVCLRESLTRLNGAVLQIEVLLENGSKVGYSGTLIESYIFKEDENGFRRNWIRLNPDIAKLFEGGLWVALDWETRKSLKGHPLAQWLHSFYSSHEKPYPYKVKTIKSLCGSDAEKLFHFRSSLKRAATLISSTTGWKMRIDDNDCLQVEKGI